MMDHACKGFDVLDNNGGGSITKINYYTTRDTSSLDNSEIFSGRKDVQIGYWRIMVMAC